MELILRGRIAGGGVSKHDVDEIKPELLERVVSFDQSISVPRQLVSVRSGLDEKVVDSVREMLIALNQTEDGRLILEGLKNTKKFDQLPPSSKTALAELRELMSLVAE